MRTVRNVDSVRARRVDEFMLDRAARWHRFASQRCTRAGGDAEGPIGPVEVLVLHVRSTTRHDADTTLDSTCDLIRASTSARCFADSRTALILAAPGPDVQGCVKALAQAPAPVTAAAVSSRTPDGIWPAAAQAGLLIALTTSLRTQPAGVLITAQDHLVDLAVLADTAACARLAEAAERLSAGPDLLSTLRAYFAHNLNAAATAAALHIHRSTLEYRLKRVNALTDVDVNTVQGIQFLAGMLVVECLERMPAGLPP
ncbi:helix-turn-helix domain-containing protein [Micromonospora sp. AKA38]|uniref:helix-turn-helix domain-containing protein n=1 Tax=Micromonospora sp. AKA38 TaxID=2733861 RepID=UPI0022C58D27|nr:helix-turn-helix domain-containing protein [Micromonospora sp. AKA38]GHJ15914.1 hypothetical protein TPA0908_39090 [Micromonospora sp. AKA38]